ncbi:Sec-independent protein translocase protein TatA [Campylobacterota bacterium]|nr:Sec-independent protein translocase protein TatA [Campylobacterota bacterium]
MGMPGIGELALIFGIVVLLFGAKKIPELAKGLGSGIKNFKHAIKEDEKPIEKPIDKPIENQAAASAEVKSAENTEKVS